MNNNEQSALVLFFNLKTITITKAKKHTRFLSSLINVNKAFKISVLMKKSNEFEMFFEKSQIQINQGSDINIMFMKLIRLFNLFIYLFSNIEFKELFIRIVDHRDIVFKY